MSSHSLAAKGNYSALDSKQLDDPALGHRLSGNPIASKPDTTVKSHIEDVTLLSLDFLGPGPVEYREDTLVCPIHIHPDDD